MLKYPLYPQGELFTASPLSKNTVSNYFKNLEETISRADPSGLSLQRRVKFWMSSHLRVIWNLIMMLVLFVLCLWIAFRAGESTGSSSVGEAILKGNAPNVDRIIDRAVGIKTAE